MSYTPGLDLNTQIENEATIAMLGTFTALGVAGLATFGFIPKEFGAVKKPADIFSIGASYALKKAMELVSDDEQANKNASQSKSASTSNVVDF